MKVYSLKHKKFGVYIGETIQSGFDMIVVEFDNPKYSEFHYPNEVLFIDKDYNNSELWRMVDRNIIPKGAIIEDQEGNQLIFTGKSFQLYYTDIDLDKKYVGFCKGDKWNIVDVNENELELKEENN